MGDSNGNNSSTSSAGAADSYIGSLISLTSKSEIRYEGILYSVDTAKSNIALQDVRSFGTEGRKKDGPQIPPSDKVYDYIIFRGTDIKDLQVKSSPPARAAQPQQLHQDPAIVSVQVQASPMALPASNGALPALTASAPTVSAGSTSNDGSNRTPYTSIPSAAYPSSMGSLYQPHAGLGSWPIPPGGNGAMPNVPMYWPGFYRPPHLPQPQQYQLPPMMPQSNYSPHSPLPPHQLLASQECLSTSAQSQAASMPMNARDSLAVASTSGQSQAAYMPMNARDSLVVASSVDKTTSSMLFASLPSASLQPTEASAEEKFFSALSTPQLSSNTTPSSLSNPQSTGAPVEPNNMQPTTSNKSESNKISADKRQPPLSEHTIGELSATREPLTMAASTSELQSSGDRPLLPLPVDSARHMQISQASGNSRYPHRGRGRGRGIRNRLPHGELMEEFDFTAMNEKFKKDEVWGELGKSDLKERGEVEEDTFEEIDEDDNISRPVPVYIKDDFFDSLSCETRGQVERNKFSEQRKLDTETFGRYSVRSHGGRWGRGGIRGGYRGGYYGGRGSTNGSRGRFYPRNAAGY